MHQLNKIIDGINDTHKGLGHAMAMAILCTKARLCLLMVAPSGCGKSIITTSIGNAYPDSFILDSATTASLSQHAEEFSNFSGLVTVDDMGKISDVYSRKHTLTALTELCYSHFITRFTFRASVVISDFYGSVVLNIQPVILAEICQYPEWESVLQDKTLRYYHLYRPNTPEPNKPELNVDWGIDINLVHKPRRDYKLFSTLERIASIQWSDARVLEHLNSLLKAVAALDRRQDVINADLQLLHKLMKPMVIERYIMQKAGFELGRWMNTNLCAVLVEFASWRNCNIERIARDYKISPSTVYRLLSEIKEWFVQDEVKSKMLVPKPELKRILKEAGVER